MTWFIYQQNNSGGDIFDNEAVSDYVWIEANNRDDADEKFWIIVEDHSEFCECCGARWSAFGSTDQESMPSAELYGPSVAYHLDGKIESVRKSRLYTSTGDIDHDFVELLKKWLLS